VIDAQVATLKKEIEALRNVVSDVVGELIKARALTDMLTTDLIESVERDANEERGTLCMVGVEILGDAQSMLEAVACGGTPAAA
jgi:hypothetical protein